MTTGVYRYIRHPMYSSLLLLAWGVFWKAPAVFRRTRNERGVSQLLSLHPRLSLDLGSYRLRLLKMGRPEIEEDLNVLALSRRGPDRTQKILALGTDALEASHALPPADVELVWPVAGVVQDVIACEAILQFYRHKVVGPLLKPTVIATIPAGCSEAAKRTLYDAALLGLNAHRVYLIEDLLAVAMSTGASQAEKPRMLLNIGAGATTVGITMNGGLMHARTLFRAGNHLDIAIHRLLWERLDRRVDLLTCRELKHAVGAVGSVTAHGSPPGALHDREGAALDLDQATPVVNQALEHGLTGLAEELRWFLRELPAEVRRSVEHQRVLLAGGTARLPGLDEWLAGQLEINVVRHPHPDRAAIEGVQQVWPQFSVSPVLLRDQSFRRTH